jgi:hypothetical protein
MNEEEVIDRIGHIATAVNLWQFPQFAIVVSLVLKREKEMQM